MICTSSYRNFNSDICTTFSISGNRGKDVNYQGKYYSKLALKLSFCGFGMIILEKFQNKRIIVIMFRNIGIKFYLN